MGELPRGSLPTENRSGRGCLPEVSQSDGARRGQWPQSRDEFAALLDSYLDRLVRYAFCKIGNIQDAEDVVQEVLVLAFRDRSKRQQISAVGPYLYRCVANACTDLLRKRDCSAVFREEVDVEGLLCPAKPPSEAAEAAEQLHRAEQLLRRLPDVQAEVVRLRVCEGLRLSEIAEVVGCPVNTVCSRLRYAFRKLQDLVAEKRE